MSRRINAPSPYAVLGLQVGASPEEAKDAWRKLCREWHPDKHQTNIEHAQARMSEINVAYEALRNPRSPNMQERYGRGSGSPSAASYRQQQQHAAWKMASRASNGWSRAFFSFAVFLGGSLTVGIWSLNSRQQTLKAQLDAEKRGYVDAWYNPGSKRWEMAPASMKKDPMLSTLVESKPPSQVANSRALFGHTGASNAGPRTRRGGGKSASEDSSSPLGNRDSVNAGMTLAEIQMRKKAQASASR